MAICCVLSKDTLIWLKLSQNNSCQVKVVVANVDNKAVHKVLEHSHYDEVGSSCFKDAVGGLFRSSPLL